MTEIEEINEPRVFPLNYPNLQRLHEPADGQPEIIPYHNDGLQPTAVALPQGLYEFCVLFAAPDV
jgi:hypothetical protein